MTSTTSSQRQRLVVAGIVLTLLLAAVFTLGSLDAPFEPRSWRDVLTLYAVSSFITAALIVFGLIISRTVLRLWAERSREQLGARFKTKVVIAAVAISLLPTIFMFFMSYSLLNRTLARWFPHPIEVAAEESQRILDQFLREEKNRLAISARAWSFLPESSGPNLAARSSSLSLCDSADAFWLHDQTGSFVRAEICREPIAHKAAHDPKFIERLSNGAEVWSLDDRPYLTASVTAANGATAFAADALDSDFLTRLHEIRK